MSVSFESVLLCVVVRFSAVGNQNGQAPVLDHAPGIMPDAAARLALGGCLLTDKPEPGLDIPQAYDGASRNPKAAEIAVPPLDWWRSFRSRELTEIIEQAREANLDIAAAVARIVQADAQSRIAGAALLPNVDLNGNATRSRSSQSTASSTGSSFGGSERDSLSATLIGELRDRFLGQEPRGAARRGTVRGRQPLLAAKWSASPRWSRPPMPISRCWRRRTGCRSRARTCKAPTACSI